MIGDLTKRTHDAEADLESMREQRESAYAKLDGVTREYDTLLAKHKDTKQ